ncbi:MAG: ATP-binding cassette domain-containing protein [Bacteroidales bacterium]|nr:ATP-binding cassette domain-containing protein [Bacteroidales bacterium]
MTAVKLDRITKRFGKYTAVDELSLVVPEGSVYGFIGPNGSGKTTTLRMIMDIIKPDSGTVQIFGSSPGTAVTSRIGYMPGMLLWTNSAPGLTTR